MKIHQWLSMLFLADNTAAVCLLILRYLASSPEPNGDGVTGPERRLHFVRIASIRPEENHSIENRFNAHQFVWQVLWEYSQQAASFLSHKSIHHYIII